MRHARQLRRLLFGLSALLLGADGGADGAHAATALDGALTIDAYADIRLVLPSSERSAFAGGLGKTRYGRETGDGPTARISEAAADLDLALPADIAAVATLRLADYQKTALDALEAYLRWRPTVDAGWQGAVKAGAFYAPISLENVDTGWSSPYTLTPSAINSWVGDELHTLGVEGRVGWSGALGRVSLVAALYGWNDPAGVLLATHGWLLDDRPVGLIDRVRLPDTLARATKPPYTASLTQETDDRPGWYAGLDIAPAGFGTISLLRYDNDAALSTAGTGIRAWRTRFWSLGASTRLGPVQLIAQAMTGDTAVQPAPTRTIVTDYQSAFLLASTDFGRLRLSARIEAFATQGSATATEHGAAATAALFWSARDWLRLGGELLAVHSVRPGRTSLARAPDVTETQAQLSARVSF